MRQGLTDASLLVRYGMTLTEFARKGGKARAQALSKERRIEIAKQAGLASAKQRASKLKACQSPQNGENKSK